MCVCLSVIDRPGPVTSLLVTVLGPLHTDQPITGHRALVTWQAPADNSTLTGYVVSYHVIGVGDCNASLSELTAVTILPQLGASNLTRQLLTGLTSWIHYRVTVWAVNVAGPGLESTTDIIMPGSGTIYSSLSLSTDYCHILHC